MEDPFFFGLCEALLYVSIEPLTMESLVKALGDTIDDRKKIEEKFALFRKDFESRSMGMTILEVAGGFQFATKPEYYSNIKRLQTVQLKARLSRPALETLAIIAYQQPITLPEVEQIRGVDCGGVLRNLLEKNLISILGRRKGPGNPILYGTTPKFLIDFGLSDLRSLPSLKEFEKLLTDKKLDEDIPSSASGNEQSTGTIQQLTDNNHTKRDSERVQGEI